MEKVVPCCENEITTSKQLKWIGNFNDLPPNWKKISTKTLVTKTKWAQYTPSFLDFKQAPIPKLNKTNYYYSIHLFIYYDDTGVAFTVCPETKKLIWFSFAKCIHEFQETNVGECLTKYTCTKCQFSETIDSSD